MGRRSRPHSTSSRHPDLLRSHRDAFRPHRQAEWRRNSFSWIVSDFGLNDAIESGLVKTPRVVVRDDAKLGKNFKSRLYHIYTDPDVKDRHEPQSRTSCPAAGSRQYRIHHPRNGLERRPRTVAEARAPTPPVMITVANRTETAARVKYALSHDKDTVRRVGDPDGILHIDSKVLGEAEAQEDDWSGRRGDGNSEVENG